MTSTDRPLGSGHHYTDEEMHNEDVAHEHSDVDIRTVLAFAGALALVVGLTGVLIYGIFRVFAYQAGQNEPPRSPLAAPAGQKPPAPGLLTNEPGNLQKFRAEERGKLESYGWMNQAGGIAHVPVEQAKKLVIQHGLPVRAGAPADETLGTHAPAYGEASSGRAIPINHAAPAAAPAQPPGTQPQPAAAPEIKK